MFLFPEIRGKIDNNHKGERERTLVSVKKVGAK